MGNPLNPRYVKWFVFSLNRRLHEKAVHHDEDLLKMPLIVCNPGTIPVGGTSETIQSAVDLAPTFLNIVGA